jgi:hypothetical protein
MKIAGEYIGVSRELWRRGVGHLATAAHQMPVTPDEAQSLIRQYCPTAFFSGFRGNRGRAYRPSGLRAARITLPAARGNRSDGVPFLRLGIVLHEIAHIRTYRNYRRVPPHGEEFCIEFAKLLKEF